MHRIVVMAAAFGWLALTGQASAAQEKVSQEEKALEKKAEEFVEAFNKGDAEALSKFWIKDGDFVSEHGRHVRGSKAIAESFEKFFGRNKGAKLRINIQSLRLVSPNVAIEDGITEVLHADGRVPTATRYSIVHVKKDGVWKLASVRESAYVAPTNYEHLRRLDWLAGVWVDDVKEGEVARAAFEWTDNRNFLVGAITTTLKDVPVSGAHQWIGWDPIQKTVRSWSFTSNGGFGQGVWTMKGSRWVIQTKSVQPDGSQLTATNIITRVGPGNITWQSTDRKVDGKAVPDSELVRMKRAE